MAEDTHQLISTQAAVFVFGPDLRYQALAGAATTAPGWRPEEIIGRRPSEVMGPAGAVVEAHMRAALAGEVRHFEHPGMPQGERFWDTLVAPLLDAAGAVIGGIIASYDVADLRRAQQERRTLQRSATVSARLAEFEAWQRERLEFLTEINDVLVRCRDRQELMAEVSAAAVPRLGDWCTIHVFMDPHDPEPTVEVAHVDPDMTAYARELQVRFPYDPEAKTGVPVVIRTGQPQLVPEVTQPLLEEMELSPEALEVVRQLDLRSAIGVPLVRGSLVIGAMQFVISGSERRYGPDDLSLAQAMAGRVAASLDNLRLIEHQRQIAETLQHSLLPQHLPEIPRVDLAVRYWAAGEGTEVGGDFYDVFEVDPQTFALVIGDVCGKGPAAAAVTALARHHIRASAWHGDDHAAVLTRLNEALLRMGSEIFCTAAYATLTTGGASVCLTVASGGHPLPLLVRPGGVSTVGEPSLLLGVFDKVDPEVATTALAPGDTLVLYTDGADDLPPPAGLSYEEWVGLVSEAAAGPGAAAVADRVAAALEARRPFGQRGDDTALIVIRVTS